MAIFDSTDIPREARPTGDGRYLYRSRGRDYVLSEEQALQLGRLSRNSARPITLLAFAYIVAFFFALDFHDEIMDRIELPWLMMAPVVLFIPVLFGAFRWHRRITAALDGCDYQEAPKAETMAARWTQKLEYDRSITQGEGGAPRRILVIGLCTILFVILLGTIASSPHTKTVATAVRETLSFGPETAKVIGLILIMSATLLFLYVVGRSTADNSLDVPREARPTGDGRFLYRFRGRDYVLTREQALRLRRPFWSQPYILGVVFLIAMASLFPESDFISTVAFQMGVLTVGLGWLLGGYWRKAVLLKGCDYRDVPEARGILDRGVRWLEHSRSIYLRDDTPPYMLFLYSLAAPAIAVWLVYSPFSGPSLFEREGLQFAIYAGLMLALIALCIVLFAVPFYAFCRAIAGKGTGS